MKAIRTSGRFYSWFGCFIPLPVQLPLELGLRERFWTPSSQISQLPPTWHCQGTDTALMSVIESIICTRSKVLISGIFMEISEEVLAQLKGCIMYN